MGSPDRTMKIIKSLFIAALAAQSEAFNAPTPVSKISRSRVSMVATAPEEIKTGGMSTIVAPKMPAGTKKWGVHKFGGASLADADLYRTCSDLLINQSQGEGDGAVPTMAIVSAMKDMTDAFVDVMETAASDIKNIDLACEKLDAIVERQVSTVKELAKPEDAAIVEASVKSDAQNVKNVLGALPFLRTIPGSTLETVSGLGEVWSAQTMSAYLKNKGIPSTWIDARKRIVIETTGGLGEKGSANVMDADPIWEQCSLNVNDWWETEAKDLGFHDLDYSKEAPIVIVTGFVASTKTGVPTTLKRSGSDYSATIFARLMEASAVTFWKNVNGMYTADPRAVPAAFSIETMKYEEAIELAYFGAQVLHPSAMTPCIDGEIPVLVKNIFNQEHPGTVIAGNACSIGDAEDAFDKAKAEQCEVSITGMPVKGITSVNDIALVSLEATSLIGVPGIAARLFSALAEAGVSVIMITQASSEHSICFAVDGSDGPRAAAAVKEAFELEIMRERVNSIRLIDDLSIVAIVGEGMVFNKGVSGKFLEALGAKNINVRAIAMGSSERQISVVVSKDDLKETLAATHMGFFNC